MDRTSAHRRPPRSECVRVLMWVGVTLAGLWAILDLPQAGAVLLPFSVLNAQSTEVTLAWLGVHVAREMTVLRHEGGFACEIHYTCTVLVPLTLLAAGVFTSGVSLRRRVLGLAWAAILLLVLNQVRLTTLMWCGIHAPAWLELMEYWLWPGVLTGVTIAYWWLWRTAASGCSWPWGWRWSATPLLRRSLRHARTSPVM